MNNYQDKINNALKMIEEGLENIQTNTDWLKFLQFQSKFYNYSLGNAMLIYMQNPNASYVKGYRAWNDLGRYVKKGEKGIAILAPCIKKVEVESKDGSFEESTIKKIVGFRIAYVYDIQSTDGCEDNLPVLVRGLSGDGETEQQIYEKLSSYISQKHTITEVQGTASKGSFNLDSKEICIRSDLSYLQKVKTILHEYAHAIDYATNPDESVSRTHRELVAESVAYIVSFVLGLDTSSYSFSYLNSWSRTKEDIKTVADTIQKVAANILNAISNEGNVLGCA